MQPVVLSATVSGVEVSAEMVAAPPDCCNGSHYVAALFSSESGDGAPLLGYGPNTTRLPAFAGGAEVPIFLETAPGTVVNATLKGTVVPVPAALRSATVREVRACDHF